MVSATMKAQLVRVKVKEGKTGIFIATSPDLKGLLVAEQTYDGLLREIPRAISNLYAACDESVLVSRIEDGNTEFIPWVAFPAEVARKELARLSD